MESKLSSSNNHKSGWGSKDRFIKKYESPLKLFGFEMEEMSANKVCGKFQVTPRCCQPFYTLHGGVSALIAEELASGGAYRASQTKTPLGLNLSISHLKTAKLGDLIYVEGAPITEGKTVQVWQVQFWKIDSSMQERRSLISSARVTILSSLPVPQNVKNSIANLSKVSKL